MPTRISGSALAEIRELYAWGAMGGWSDDQLTDRFVMRTEESEAAFRVLIRRHGPMVLGICRRILGDEHAAEDAFQATFLVFVKKAGKLRDKRLLTSWLYGVATRVSQKERARRHRRQAVERRAAERAVLIAGPAESSELPSLIDEEIRKLPERYRVPLLLCHIEGLGHDEVARRLGCPVGTVESRLSRARERLRTGLARRGLTSTASAMASLLRPVTFGPVPTSLVESTLHVVATRLTERLTRLAAAQALFGRAGRAVAGLHLGAGTAAAAMAACAAAVAVGCGWFGDEAPNRLPSPPVAVAAADPPDAAARPTTAPPAPRRTPRAIARPMPRITIDGRLDDWPGGLPRYPIRHLFTGAAAAKNYREELAQDRPDLEADFRVGYDPRAGLIYLAIVVRDDELVSHGPYGQKPGSEIFQTDAVEVYIDGAFSDRRIPEPSGDWNDELDATTMPVLQYAGVATEMPSLEDPRAPNPTLVHTRILESHTRMACRRDEEAKLTTYEWAIRAYDRFPEAPTPLAAGRRIGLDVAVVDKDSGPGKPAFVTWGPPARVFKGLDAGSLGELYLDEGP